MLHYHLCCPLEGTQHRMLLTVRACVVPDKTVDASFAEATRVFAGAGHRPQGGGHHPGGHQDRHRGDRAHSQLQVPSHALHEDKRHSELQNQTEG